MPETAKKIYFLSDFHLGAPNEEISKEREREICTLLDRIKDSCQELYLVGDIFDFWFEYKHAAPRGFVRFLGKIAEFTDSGILVKWFTGNHDMWIFDYLPKELGIELIRKPIEVSYFGKSLFIGHGDGLGPKDYKYKLLKKFFDSKLCQWAFARLHPNFGIGLANWSSYRSRKTTGTSDRVYLGKENEWLYQYCQRKESQKHRDLYIFGHRHLPLKLNVNPNATYYNLGEWIYYKTFGILDENGFQLVQWKGGQIVSFDYREIQDREE
jgi:UDP-2,3-diacylglucosamine hydrolase